MPAMTPMTEFPTIAQMLRTIYNAQDGLGEEASIRLYQRAAAAGDNRTWLETELRAAFSRGDLSWRAMLCDGEYEVADLATEDEARGLARRLLWGPLFGAD